MTDTIKLSLLSLWLGTALFFSAVVAPAVFGVLRQFNLPNTNEIAGGIVSRSLAVVNMSGFIIAVVLLAATVLWKRKRGLVFVVQLLALATLTVTTAVGHWVVASLMLALRGGLSIPIDGIALDDPRRIAFNQLHGYSVTLLSIAMIAAILAIVLSGVQRNASRQG
jgi:hypothetical protein